MRKLLFLLMLSVLLSTKAIAGSVVYPSVGNAIPVAPMQLGVSVTTAVTPSWPATASSVLIICSGATLWRDDGTAPTTTVGFPLAANTLFTYGGNSNYFQIIGAAGGTCNFAYYKGN